MRGSEIGALILGSNQFRLPVSVKTLDAPPQTASLSAVR